METYLEALEQLGKLLDSGVLTKEEFETEKARLLRDRTAKSTDNDKPPRQRMVLYVVASSIAAVGWRRDCLRSPGHNSGKKDFFANGNQDSSKDHLIPKSIRHLDNFCELKQVRARTEPS